MKLFNSVLTLYMYK